MPIAFVYCKLKRYNQPKSPTIGDLAGPKSWRQQHRNGDWMMFFKCFIVLPFMLSSVSRAVAEDGSLTFDGKGKLLRFEVESEKLPAGEGEYVFRFTRADESQQSVELQSKKQTSLMSMLGEWMYPESKFNGAETGDAAVSNISAIKSKAIFSTKDSVDKVMEFYRNKLNVDNDGKNLSEREGERITTDHSVLIQDVSGDRQSSLFVIAINGVNSSTTVVVNRADGDDITRIAWSNYRQRLNVTQQPR